VKSFTAQKKAIGVRRIAAALLWWVLLMSFWVILDDSFAADELLAGAGAAAIGAFLAELAAHQGASQVRLRAEWLLPALRLPWMLIRDTGVVGLVLLRRLTRGELPPSGFRERPVTYGPDSAEGKTRRSLLIGGLSVAPNSFVLGLDKETNVMVVHELVTGDREASD
jgi:multisubunit Na+/H+ antiporter MnhE subunit